MRVTSPARVALVGFGVMGRNHARVVSLSSKFELVGVFDAYAKDAVEASGFKSLTGVTEIASLKPDYVVVASPTSTHEDLGIALIDKGINLLIEKPVASTLAGAESILSAASQSDAIVKIGFIERFNPSLAALRTKIEQGVLGEILQISTFRHGPYSSRISDVGVGMDLMSHDLDLAKWISGAELDNANSVRFSVFRDGFEDSLEVVGRMANGVQVTHSANRLSPTKRRETYVWGTLGMLHADSLRSELKFYANGEFSGILDPSFVFNGVSVGDVTTFALNPVEPLLKEHEAMVEELSSPNTTSMAGLFDGVAVNKALDKILS